MSEQRSGGGMSSGRLEAFTDGVVAIIITIMVLELKVPRDGSLAALSDSLPILLAYILSFINVGLYWNNHHHLLHAADRIDGKVLWANLFLLFWLSLVPFVIRWRARWGRIAKARSRSPFTPLPYRPPFSRGRWRLRSTSSSCYPGLRPTGGSSALWAIRWQRFRSRRDASCRPAFPRGQGSQPAAAAGRGRQG